MWAIPGFEGGIAIVDIWPDSPATRFGIQPGDILVKFAHYPIRSPADFQKWLYMYGVGQKINMTLIRGTETYVTEDYVIEERPERAVPK